MTSNLTAYARCWGCGMPFFFDPDLVCSLPIDPETNLPADLGGDPERVVREAICLECVVAANIKRLGEGRELIQVLVGAYPEMELP